MQATDQKISELMNKSFFTIPSYQREYSWKKEQLEKLWEDAQYQFDLINDVTPHYLGSLVIKERPSLAELDVFEVIDGQQRLTTYSIFVAACLANLNVYHKDEEYLRGELRNLIYNSPGITRNYSDSDKEKYRKKIELLYADKEAFNLIMTLPERNDERLRKMKKNLLIKAYSYFHLEIEKFLGVTVTERKSPEALRSLDKLYTTISEHFKVVVIVLNEKDNVQRIFETLNNRGKPLEEKDSIKNLLMMNYPGNTELASNIYETYWRNFEISNFWKEPGNGAKDKLSHFLYIYVAQRYPESKIIEASRLSRKYEEIIKLELISDGTKEKYDAFLQDISEAALWYESHQNFDLSTPEGEFLEVITKANKSMWVPALWLHKNSEEIQITLSDLELTRKILSSWVVLRTVANLANTKQGIEVGILNTLKDFKREKELNKNLKLYPYLLKWMKESKAEFTRFPLREELERAIVNKIELPLAKMLLENIEDYENSSNLSTPPNERTPRVSRDLTVEHFMPQDWEQYWKLDVAATVEDIQRRNIKVGTLGNLALLDGPTNSSIKNLSWQHKVSKLKNYGQSNHTRNTVNKYSDSWNEITINKRSLELLEIILKIWSTP